MTSSKVSSPNALILGIRAPAEGFGEGMGHAAHDLILPTQCQEPGMHGVGNSAAFPGHRWRCCSVHGRLGTQSGQAAASEVLGIHLQSASTMPPLPTNLRPCDLRRLYLPPFILATSYSALPETRPCPQICTARWGVCRALGWGQLLATSSNKPRPLPTEGALFAVLIDG